MSSTEKRQRTSPNDLSFQDSSPSPRARRKSLRRSVGKKRRRTLPPIYHNATSLSDAISLSLPENDRIMELIHACFQCSVLKLENSFSQIGGFDASSFKATGSAVKQKMLRFTKRLSRDGTLKRCTEGSTSLLNNEDVESLQDKVRSGISVMTSECLQWEELLEDYKRKAEEMSRQLEENEIIKHPLESDAHMLTSQEILQSKPDYKAILCQQGAVLDNMEIVLDEVQQSVQLIDSFSSETSLHLQQLSAQLQSKSFKPMEDSPVRAFLRVSKK
ncbi:kinetochore-associated protein DSN1 homolog isoform 2-T2 [Mantella aurantiaca]